MATTLDAVNCQGFPSAETIPSTQGMTTAGREPASRSSAYTAGMSPSDCPLSLGNWFTFYRTASAYPHCKGIGTGTWDYKKGYLPVMGSPADKLSLGKCLSLP